MIIYLIVNLLTGKSYVGQTNQRLKRRWSQHQLYARKNVNRPLYNDINKYGLENFSIFSLAESTDPTILNAMEKYYVRISPSLYPSGYNLRAGGKSGGSGYKPTLEHRTKISNSMKGRSFTTEHRKNLSQAALGNINGKGKILSDSERETLRRSRLGAISAKRRAVIGTHIVTGETIELPYISIDNRFVGNAISRCCSKKYRDRSHRGYIWRYQNDVDRS